MQLGGAVIIDVSGVVRYFFAGKKAGEHPDVDQLLKVGDINDTTQGIHLYPEKH